jgi:hypothetical protein
MWGGRGDGSGCAVCEEPIRPDQLELELEFARESTEEANQNPHVHTLCFTAWQLESRARKGPRPSDLPAAEAAGTMPRRGLDLALRRESA